MNPYTDTNCLYSLLSSLPPWYKEIAMGIDTSISTNCEYCRDVAIFFRFLIHQNPKFKDYKTTDFQIQDIENITPLDAREYVLYLSSRYSPSTSARKLAAVSSMYVHLMRYNRVSSNPFAIVERPKVKSNVIVYLNNEEIKRLFHVIESGEGMTKKQLQYHFPTRDLALFSFFLDTGARISEVVGLNYIDVDLEDCSAIVQRKGGKHEQIYFSDYTCGLLMNYVDERGIYFDSQDPMFIGRRGTRLSARSIEKLLENYARIAFPTKHISPHKLRSSFAMNFYAKTHDLLLLKDKMGHSDIRTTNIYASSLKEKSRETRNILFGEDIKNK